MSQTRYFFRTHQSHRLITITHKPCSFPSFLRSFTSQFSPFYPFFISTKRSNTRSHSSQHVCSSFLIFSNFLHPTTLCLSKFVLIFTSTANYWSLTEERSFENHSLIEVEGPVYWHCYIVLVFNITTIFCRKPQYPTQLTQNSTRIWVRVCVWVLIRPASKDCSLYGIRSFSFESDRRISIDWPWRFT